MASAAGSRRGGLEKAALSGEGERCVVPDAGLRGHSPGTGEVRSDDDASVGRVLPEVSGRGRDSVSVRTVLQDLPQVRRSLQGDHAYREEAGRTHGGGLGGERDEDSRLRHRRRKRDASLRRGASGEPVRLRGSLPGHGYGELDSRAYERFYALRRSSPHGGAGQSQDRRGEGGLVFSGRQQNVPRNGRALRNGDRSGQSTASQGQGERRGNGRPHHHLDLGGAEE